MAKGHNLNADLNAIIDRAIVKGWRVSTVDGRTIITNNKQRSQVVFTVDNGKVVCLQENGVSCVARWMRNELEDAISA